MKPTACLRRLLAITLFLLGCLQAPAAFAQKVLVLPYVQPGDGRTLSGADVKVIHWLTDQNAGNFVVEYQLPWGKVQSVKPIRTALDFPAPAKQKAKEIPKKEAG